jgi:hypothetical protein
MVALFFGHRTGAVDKGKRRFEIGKTIDLVKVMLVHNVPARNVALERIELSAFQRRNAAPARNTSLIR